MSVPGGERPSAESVQLNPVGIFGDAGYLVTMSLSWQFDNYEDAEEVSEWAEHELGIVARKIARKSARKAQ